ncbi:MAG: phosphoribosylamine--glycine ligase [Candidatus Cloacimonetes bacterium]|nr:phosphoribosylamine--glycine ligase [Candidatus Cloacimonadota bacterium]
MKNILVLGSGAREHAIASKFQESKNVANVYVIPGNDGIDKEFVTMKTNDFVKIYDFILANKIDLVFVGNEQFLADGIVNFLNTKEVNVIGPTMEAAQIESSKVFSKYLMKQGNIPTAKYQNFQCADKATEYIQDIGFPIVIKASGLAAGKGVLIAQDIHEATHFIQDILCGDKFGSAGEEIVIEEYLQGEEVSVFAFCDGENFVSTIFSQDHKTAFDDDKGLNTGGMGAYAPVDKYSYLKDDVDRLVFEPILREMKKEGCPFVGVLYAGLMINRNINVIEFNCRFGDPEAQVILPLLENDLYEICEAIIEKRVHEIKLKWKDQYAVAVVLASIGYPEKFEKDYSIFIDFELLRDENLKIFFSGVEAVESKIRIPEKMNDMLLLPSLQTTNSPKNPIPVIRWGREGNYHFLTRAGGYIHFRNNGGRVMSIVALDDTLEEAIQYVYTKIDLVKSEILRYRSDIGRKGLVI